MANDFFKNMPSSLRSIWQLENELRRALQNAVLLRKDDAKQNLELARRHMEAALSSVRGEKPEEPVTRSVGPSPDSSKPPNAD